MIRFLRSAPLALLVAVAVSACADSTAPSASDGYPLQLAVVGPQLVSAAENAALGDAFDTVDEYSVNIVDAATLEQITDTVIDITPGGVLHTLDINVPDEAFGRTVTITLIAYANGVELYRSTLTVSLGDEIGQIPVELEIRYTGPGIRGTLLDYENAPVGGVSVDLYQGETLIDSTTTEDDGTYLFVDLAPGSYDLFPYGGQTVDVCPGYRQVTLSAGQALVANFFAVAGGCQTSVLVLSGGDFDRTDTIATLLGGGFDVVSTFFYENQPPAMDFLRAHDVILLFTNGIFDESAALGDQLAEYVELGGNLVIGSFAYQGRSDSGLGSVGWGALESIDPFTALVDPVTGFGGATYQPVSLDPNSVAAHPIMEGVTNVASAAFSSGVIQKDGTSVLARWDDGVPMVGYRLGSAGQRIVGISLYPVPDQTITGDVNVLWTNALRWASFAPPPVP